MQKLKQWVKFKPRISANPALNNWPLKNIKRDKRCRIFRTMGNIRKSRPPLSQAHAGFKISASRPSVKMSAEFQNGSDILRIIFDGDMFIL